MKALPSISIVTLNEGMRGILARVDTIAASSGTVLLMGETGVGKELFADHIHHLSLRREKPFIKISLSAMPHDLLESELFGHEKGAFTNALNEKKGLFELAHGGTLFLDDIDDVPQGIQTKLLRVLESGEVMRVGGITTIPVDVRLITASKVDLRELVGRNLFRADLFYRINVIPMEIPPLRERREDILPLLRHFLNRFAPHKPLTIAPDAEKALSGYSWPGNVRELRNISQRIALFANGQVTLQDLPPEIHSAKPLDELIRECSKCMIEESVTFNQVVSCLEINLLRQALSESAGNRTQAARMLGLSLSTLRDKLKKYNLDSGSDPL